jgi:hypothetical protein
MSPEQIDIELLYITAQRNMKDKQPKRDLIPMPEGTTGQNPQWPDDGHAPESGTDSTDTDGTREPEKIHIPIVR